MTHIYLDKTWRGRWRATYPTGERTFIQGHYLYDSKTFGTLASAIDWAKSNYYTLDKSPGGGYGIGVTVCIDKIVVAEYYREYPTNKEVIIDYFKPRGW